MDVLATHGKARTWPALAGFMLDLLLAVLLLLALTLFCGLAWAVARGVQLGIGGSDLANLPVLVKGMGPPSAIATIWMTLVSTGGAAVIMYAWRHRATQAERLQSRQAAGRVGTWGWVVVTGVATFIFSAALSLLGERYGIRPQPSNLPLIQAAANTSPVFMMLFGVLIAPAYEELLFRRVLFGRLWAAGKPWLGVFLSSAAFALMHEIPGVGGNSWQATGLLWAVYGFMGAAFAMLYWRTRTLWACIGAHALNNVIALTLLSLSATA